MAVTISASINCFRRIGNTDCFTGAFCPRPSPLHRIAIATEKARNKILSDANLISKLANNHRAGALQYTSLLREAGLEVIEEHGINNWLTFGISIFQSHEDTLIFIEGQKKVISMEEGQHRLIFFWMKNIKVPDSLAGLHPNLYGAIIKRIHVNYKDPEMEKVAEIRIRESGFEISSSTSNGLIITFSLGQLEKEKPYYITL